MTYTTIHNRKFICSFILFGICGYFSGCSNDGSKPAILPDASNPVVATVNLQPIRQDRLLEELLPAYGGKMLEEIVHLEIVRQAAAERDVTLTQEQLAAEFNRLLEDMAPGKPRREQLALLNYLLESRRLTRQEFDMIVERQALLRQMIDPVVTITEQMIETEHDRQYGRKVMVRQIVAGSFRTIQNIKRQLDDGTSMVRLIQQYSEDQPSTSRDGLLGPFTRQDEAIPAPLRAAAFALNEPGSLSEPVRFYDEDNNEWWAILRLEKILPAEEVPLAQARDELIGMIQHRILNERMLELQRRLKKRAAVNITSPFAR